MQDLISLSVPCKPEYVSVVRLAASGVASRMGFDFDSVEDIKVAVSEVCNKIVESEINLNSNFVIDFIALDDKIEIGVRFTGGYENLFGENEEFSLAIIGALVDEVSTQGIGEYSFKLSKNIRKD